MQFVIKRQFGRGSDVAFAEFTEMNEATFYIGEKLKSDQAQNIKVIYRIYELNEVIKEFDPNKMNTQEQSSQGKGSTASFRPTPLNTTPRPPGSPPNWLKEEDKKEDEKKK